MTLSRAATAAAFMIGSGCSGPPGPVAKDDEIATIERHSYAVPGAGPLKVSYLRGGRLGGRRVIFVHGTPGDATGWADFLLNVPQGFEFIAIDRPGFGRTVPATAEPSLERQARAIGPLLVRAGGYYPILIGHSLGGPIVARVAADYPDRVEGLIILAGSLDPTLEKIHPMQPIGEWWGVRAVLPASLRNANRELLPLKGELTRLTPLLSHITVPVSIIHGTADPLVPIANVPFMQAHFVRSSRVRTVILPGQNHFLPWEHRSVIASALAEMAAL